MRTEFTLHLEGPPQESELNLAHRNLLRCRLLLAGVRSTNPRTDKTHASGREPDNTKFAIDTVCATHRLRCTAVRGSRDFKVLRGRP